MPLSNTQIRYYDAEVLRLPQEKRKQYHAQVDNLVSKLSASIREKTSIRITKVVKAGSFAKYTILRKTSEDPVDVDIVFYIAGRSVKGESRMNLLDKIYELLVEIYPSKQVDDFEIQRKAATVEFVGSGLTVDIVPVIQDAKHPDYGWQFGTDGSVTLTCAPGQIQFVQTRKNTDKDFRTLVRMGKRWRKQAELNALKGFTIELIAAHTLAKWGTAGSLEERFRRFLMYITQSGLKEVISFPENTKPLGSFTHPVVIIDPVNSDNNVASRITEEERLEIVAEAKKSWEAATLASVDDDIDGWKVIFGNRFKVED